MTAPATPAPADGAPGERVSDFPGVWTTHPMTREGAVKLMGQFWHAVDGATIHYLSGEQPTAEEIAKSEEAGRIAKEIEQQVIAMLSMPFTSAAPLPAPSPSAGVDAETLAEWRALVGEAFVACKAETTDRETLASMLGAHGAALRAACDALSTAAAPVRPDREAMTSALVAIAEAARPGGRDGLAIDAAIRSARALVFGDDAPGGAA